MCLILVNNQPSVFNFLGQKRTVLHSLSLSCCPCMSGILAREVSKKKKYNIMGFHDIVCKFALFTFNLLH